MTIFVWSILVLSAFNFIMDLVNLVGDDYPRTVKKSRGTDNIGALLHLGLIVWTAILVGG